MKHILLKGLCATGLLCAILTSCQTQLPDTIQSKIDSSKETVSEKVSNTLLDIFKEQLHAFIHSDDIKNSLGLSEEDQAELQQSIDSYLNQYDWNMEELEKVKQDITDLFQNFAKDKNLAISNDELNQKLNEILNQKSDL